MKYFIRAIKYFVYISFLMFFILAVLAMMGMISTDINVIFQDGYTSLLKIGIMFLGVSLIYPKFGYSKRGVVIPGEYSQIRGEVIRFMDEHKYFLESEDEEKLCFRLKSITSRIFRIGEDRVTMTRDIAGFVIEGSSKDIHRIVYGLEENYRNSVD